MMVDEMHLIYCIVLVWIWYGCCCCCSFGFAETVCLMLLRYSAHCSKILCGLALWCCCCRCRCFFLCWFCFVRKWFHAVMEYNQKAKLLVFLFSHAGQNERSFCVYYCWKLSTQTFKVIIQREKKGCFSIEKWKWEVDFLLIECQLCANEAAPSHLQLSVSNLLTYPALVIGYELYWLGVKRFEAEIESETTFFSFLAPWCINQVSCTKCFRIRYPSEFVSNEMWYCCLVTMARSLLASAAAAAAPIHSTYQVCRIDWQLYEFRFTNGCLAFDSIFQFQTRAHNFRPTGVRFIWMTFQMAGSIFNLCIFSSHSTVPIYLFQCVSVTQSVACSRKHTHTRYTIVYNMLQSVH